MTRDKSIFGLRFRSDETLFPTAEELRSFLDEPDGPGARKTRGDDLAPYSELLERVSAFERRGTADAVSPDFREKMFFGALVHSRFFNPALVQEVGQFKYQLHALQALDFKKPSAFIKSAEEEIGRLNPKKKEEAARIARLRGMVEERKTTLAGMNKRRAALAAELENIVRYIRDNLVKIRKLCETSIVVLVDLQLTRKKENRMIEDIKTEFKERVRDALHAGGAVTKQDLEAIKQEVSRISDRLSVLLREDIYDLTGLFEAVHDHVRKPSHEFDDCLNTFGDKKDPGFEESNELFTRAGETLVSLVSDIHFELPAPRPGEDAPHERILTEKRKEMIEYVFELLNKERRTRTDRRAGKDRRTPGGAAAYTGSERRTGKERRVRRHRRA
jgi:hypothetical protein